MQFKVAIGIGIGIFFFGLAGFMIAGKSSPPPPTINCKYVSCAAPDCLDNEHLQVPPGQCCPVCVPN